MEITNDMQTIFGRKKAANAARVELKQSSADYGDRLMNAKMTKEVAEELYAFAQYEDAGKAGFIKEHEDKLRTGEEFLHHGHRMRFQKKQDYDYSKDETMRTLDALYKLKTQELHTVALERRAKKSQMRANGTAIPVGEPKIVTLCLGLPKGTVVEQTYTVDLDNIA